MQKPKQLDQFFLYGLIGLTTALVVAGSSPSFREFLRDTFLSNSRQVLAKVEGDLTGQGDLISVIKVKTKNDLILEVYSLEPKKNETQMRARLILPEKKDGYFQFRDQPTNLALADLNGDGILEILAPAFDDNLIPRLHIYRYDTQAQVFLQAGPEFLPLEPVSVPR